MPRFDLPVELLKIALSGMERFSPYGAEKLKNDFGAGALPNYSEIPNSSAAPEPAPIQQASPAQRTQFDQPAPKAAPAAVASPPVQKPAVVGDAGARRLNLGGDLDLDAVRGEIERKESRGNPLAKNPTTSAAGSLQFVRGTAAGYAAQDPADFKTRFGYDPAVVKSMSRGQYQDFVTSKPEVTDWLWKREAAEAQGFMKQHKVAPAQAANVMKTYHYLGPTGARQYVDTGTATVPGEGTTNIPLQKYLK